MQPTDWINAATHLGPWIVAVVAIIAWGVRGFPNAQTSTNRQTELLERISAQLDKLHS